MTVANPLFVGCPNLGPAGLGAMRQVLSRTSGVLWDREKKSGIIIGPDLDLEDQLEVQPRCSRAQIREFITGGTWSLLVSFYNDMIFKGDELAQAELRVNIHPALPQLGGRAYDTIPLIHGHPSHGVTLHFLEEQVDSGPIIRVVSRELGPRVNYLELRRRNQLLCLEVLQTFLGECTAVGELGELARSLRHESAKMNQSWGHAYRLDEIGRCLRELREKEPQHRVFEGLPDYYLAAAELS